MNKGKGKKIAIKFNLPLIGDLEGNEGAFTISGQEYLYTDGPDNNGELVDKDYQVEKVERYPIPKVWELEKELKLDLPSEMSITDSKCYEIKSGTTLTGTVNANAGDIVLATITHRSTFTMPDGWDKLYESNIGIGSSGQKMVFATKKIDQTGEVSFTAKQSSSARIYLNLIAIGGISCIENANYEAISTSEVTSINAPDKIEREKLIWGCSANMWVLSDYGSWETVPDDLQMVSLDSTTQARQANFIDFGEGTPTGRSFIPNAADTGTEIIVNSVRLIQEYTTPKVYTTEPIQLTGQYRIKYILDEPTNTNIKIEISTGAAQGEWQEVSNGEVITADTNLWIKITLTTEDATVTPILQSLWLEEPEAPQDTIRLIMADSFRNAQGDMIIKYNQALGNLKGTGGVVASFEETFTPADLVEQPDGVRVREYINASMSGNMELIYISKLSTEPPREYINASMSGKIELINIEEVNP